MPREGRHRVVNRAERKYNVHMNLRFEWDPSKATINLRKHGVC